MASLRGLGNGYLCPRLTTITSQHTVCIVEGTTLTRLSVISTMHGQKATLCVVYSHFLCHHVCLCHVLALVPYSWMQS